MVKNINIAKIWRLLIVIPALLLLFACDSVDNTTTAVDPTADVKELEFKHRECWQAPVVGAIYDTTSHITMGMYEHMTEGAMALMMIAFAVWMAWKMIAHVSSFVEESPAQVWTDVLRKLFLCLVCGLLASSPTGVIWVLNSIIFPIYNAFLELGSAMLDHMSSNGVGDQSLKVTEQILFFPAIGELESTYDAKCMVSGLDPATQEGFPEAPKQMMECLVCAVNERMNFGYSLGWAIISQPGFMALICGLIMMLIFTIVKIGFVFYLVDSVFRFAMMVLMMPILIMAFAFKPTRGWTKTGFLTILNSGAFMMFIAIIILMAMAALQQILLDNKPIFENDMASLADFSRPLLMLMLVGFLLIGALDIAKDLAGKLIGGSGSTNFQQRIGTAFGKAGKWAVLGVGGAAGDMILRNSSKLRNFNAGAKRIHSKINSFAGRE